MCTRDVLVASEIEVGLPLLGGDRILEYSASQVRCVEYCRPSEHAAAVCGLDSATHSAWPTSVQSFAVSRGSQHLPPRWLPSITTCRSAVV